jgi:hypothetical protein
MSSDTSKTTRTVTVELPKAGVIRLKKACLDEERPQGEIIQEALELWWKTHRPNESPLFSPDSGPIRTEAEPIPTPLDGE